MASGMTWLARIGVETQERRFIEEENAEVEPKGEND